MNAVPAHTAPVSSVWKPVSPTSIASQASSIREEVASRNRDWKEISLFIDLRYRRSLVPCDDRKEFMHGRKLVGSLSSHHQSDRVWMNVIYYVSLSTQDGFLVTEGPDLWLAPICVDTGYPKGKVFRTIRDTEAATVLGLIVVVLSLSLSSSLTA